MDARKMTEELIAGNWICGGKYDAQELYADQTLVNRITDAIEAAYQCGLVDGAVNTVDLFTDKEDDNEPGNA